MHGNSLRFFIYFLLSTLLRDLAMMLCVHLLCGFFPLHSPLDCVLTYCRSTSQGRTDTGSHLILSTANRLQLVSLHRSLGIFLWKTRCGLSSQGRKRWSIWNSVGKVFADPYASLPFLYDLSFMFGSLFPLMSSLYRVLVLCLSIQWIRFNLFFSFSNSQCCLCVPILPLVWLPPETDFIDSGVAGAMTRK